MSEHQKKVEKLLETIAEQTKIQTPIASEKPKHGETLPEKMGCKDCNPPEEYKKAHLELMGQKECKDCGNVDKKEEEYCEGCGNEYPKA